jgi:transcriptional regulator with XRE-family HTH domain
VCEFCEGEGQVSSEAGERWRAGKAMRDARVKQGLTQEQEAERLGISRIELNDLEHGQRSLDEPNRSTIAEKDQSRGRGANREVKKMSLNRVSLIGHLGQDPDFGICPTAVSRSRDFRSRPMRALRGKMAIARSESSHYGTTGSDSQCS